MRRLGVDLGGTKIEVVVLDGSGAERCRRRVPTPRGDYAATLAAIAGLVGEAERSAGPCGSIGVGIPGSISPHTGLVRNANSTWLNGRPLAGDLARALGRDVRVANDANCFALSEATDGAAAGLAVVFGVILGTGVGGGIVVDGRVLEGANGIAGEWGHNPLPAPFLVGELPGPRCWCGRHGCIEAWLSGPALAAGAAPSGTGAAAGAGATPPSNTAVRQHRRCEVGHSSALAGRRGVAQARELEEIPAEAAGREVLCAEARFGDRKDPRQQAFEPELQVLTVHAHHGDVPYDGSSVRIARASSMRARWARDLTVPSGRERSSAISSSLSSCVSLRRITSRFFSLSSPRAR